MVTLGEVHSLGTPRGAIIGRIWLLWVFISLENAFAAILDLKMLSDIGTHTKPQLQSPCSLMQIFLYIIQTLYIIYIDSIPSKIAFSWSHLHVSQNCLKMFYNNYCDFEFKKVSFSIQKDIPWCMKLMLNSSLKFQSNGWAHATLAAAALTLLEMFNSIFKAFSDMLRVSKIVSWKSELYIPFGINTTRDLSTSTLYHQGINIWASSVLWQS